MTFHIYPTTYLITIQGSKYLEWVNIEFPYLKDIVDHHFNTHKQNESIVGEPNTNSLLENSETYNNFVTVLDQSETQPMKLFSTPRLVIPKAEKKDSCDNLLSTIQLLEGRVCELTDQTQQYKHSYDNLAEKLKEEEAKQMNNKTLAMTREGESIIKLLDEKICELTDQILQSKQDHDKKICELIN